MQRSEIVMVLLGVSGATLLTLGGLVVHVWYRRRAATEAGERADAHVEQAGHGVVVALDRSHRRGYGKAHDGDLFVLLTLTSFGLSAIASAYHLMASACRSAS